MHAASKLAGTHLLSSQPHYALLRIPAEETESPQSYRLIALLSALSKGLERVIARRLAWIAVKRKILPPRYSGAVPLRSTADLTILLTNKIEGALRKGHKVSVLTFDIHGGFDTVLPGRVLHRLTDQGRPKQVLALISYFLTSRQAAIRLDGATGSQFTLHGSLPQGSLVLSVLFMLYMQPLFSALYSTIDARPQLTVTCYGYADDGCLVAASPTLANNITALKNSFAKVLAWCGTKNIPF